MGIYKLGFPQAAATEVRETHTREGFNMLALKLQGLDKEKKKQTENRHLNMQNKLVVTKGEVNEGMNEIGEGD